MLPKCFLMACHLLHRLREVTGDWELVSKGILRFSKELLPLKPNWSSFKVNFHAIIFSPVYGDSVFSTLLTVVLIRAGALR